MWLHWWRWRNSSSSSVLVFISPVQVERPAAGLLIGTAVSIMWHTKKSLQWSVSCLNPLWSSVGSTHPPSWVIWFSLLGSLSTTWLHPVSRVDYLYTGWGDRAGQCISLLPSNINVNQPHFHLIPSNSAPLSSISKYCISGVVASVTGRVSGHCLSAAPCSTDSDVRKGSQS